MQQSMHQDTLTNPTLTSIQRFHEAVNQHDMNGVMAAMTEDCVFESTYPPPDGPRYQGQVAVRGFFEQFFRSSPHAAFETEEVIVFGLFTQSGAGGGR